MERLGRHDFSPFDGTQGRKYRAEKRNAEPCCEGQRVDVLCLFPARGAAQERTMGTMVSGRVGMSEAEWQARCDLAALYRITELFGWTDTIDTHMSVRIPGEPDC